MFLTVLSPSPVFFISVAVLTPFFDPLTILSTWSTAVGFSGGLKGCETKAGIERGNLIGLDGYDAVLLWYDYQRNGNQKALKTLLAYNSQDIVNLETLMVMAYNLKLKDTPFGGVNELPEPAVPEIPFEGGS
jgi:hypothetical protein